MLLLKTPSQNESFTNSNITQNSQFLTKGNQIIFSTLHKMSTDESARQHFANTRKNRALTIDAESLDSLYLRRVATVKNLDHNETLQKISDDLKSRYPYLYEKTGRNHYDNYRKNIKLNTTSYQVSPIKNSEENIINLSRNTSSNFSYRKKSQFTIIRYDKRGYPINSPNLHFSQSQTKFKRRKSGEFEKCPDKISITFSMLMGMNENIKELLGVASPKLVGGKVNTEKMKSAVLHYHSNKGRIKKKYDQAIKDIQKMQRKKIVQSFGKQNISQAINVNKVKNIMDINELYERYANWNLAQFYKNCKIHAPLVYEKIKRSIQNDQSILAKELEELNFTDINDRIMQKFMPDNIPLTQRKKSENINSSDKNQKINKSISIDKINEKHNEFNFQKSRNSNPNFIPIHTENSTRFLINNQQIIHTERSGLRINAVRKNQQIFAKKQTVPLIKIAKIDPPKNNLPTEIIKLSQRFKIAKINQIKTSKYCKKILAKKEKNICDLMENKKIEEILDTKRGNFTQRELFEKSKKEIESITPTFRENQIKLKKLKIKPEITNDSIINLDKNKAEKTEFVISKVLENRLKTLSKKNNN